MSNFPRTHNGRTWKEASKDRQDANRKLLALISTHDLIKAGGYIAHAQPFEAIPFMLPLAMQGIIEELARREALAEKLEAN